MTYLWWIVFVVSFCSMGVVPTDSGISYVVFGAMCLSLILAVIETVKVFLPKKQQQVIISQIGDDDVKTQKINVEQSQSVGKLEVKRGMKKDSQVFKLIKLAMLLGCLVGVSIMGMETVKSLALVIAIVLGCIIALFLFIVLPLMIVFKDTVKMFITKKKED